MLGLSDAPTLASTPGLAGAGGPMVRAPRRHNVSCLRRLHPNTQQYLDRCRAISAESGILSGLNIDARIEVDRFARGLIDLADWQTIAAWIPSSGHSVGLGSVVPMFGGSMNVQGSFIGTPTWSHGGLFTSSSGDGLGLSQASFPPASPATMFCGYEKTGFASNVRLYVGSVALATRGYMVQIGPLNATISAVVDRTDQPNWYIWNQTNAANTAKRTVAFSQATADADWRCYTNGAQLAPGTHDGTKSWASANPNTVGFYQSGGIANHSFVVSILLYIVGSALSAAAQARLQSLFRDTIAARRNYP